MKFRASLLLAIAILFSATAFSQQKDEIVVPSILKEVLENGQAYDNLRVLTKQIGHRLSGSKASEKTVIWAKAALLAAGADSVWLQPVLVPKWTRGIEHLTVKQGKRTMKLAMTSLGNSEGTKGKLLNASIIYFEQLKDLENADPKEVSGKIVYLNGPFPLDHPCTFDGYSEIGANRYRGPGIASKKGAIGYILRSLSTGVDDVPHTGVMFYGDAQNKIPSVALGNASADSLKSWLEKGEVTAQLQSDCGMKGEVMSYNIIGELKGEDAGIITIGGHHDSWDVGEGAQDDGAGCVQSIELIRVFKALKLKPKHTIRAVLFANEENGARGGKTYADSAVSKKERHIFALESDAGGFTPRGFSLEMDSEKKALISSWGELLLPFGIYDFSRAGGGVDISPLQKAFGTSLADLSPDSQRYFDLHHTTNDVFEAVNKRELELGAGAMAALIFLVDQHFE